jgi:hypothetical protein
MLSYFLWVFVVVLPVTVTSCNHSNGSSDPVSSPTPKGETTPPLDLAKTHATEQKVKDGKLNEKYYSLKSDVDFSQGIAHSYNQPNGTPNDTIITRHSFPYHDQKLMTPAEESEAPSYCNLYIETSTDLKPGEMIVKARAGMAGQNLFYAAYNENVGVTIGFSLGAFRQVTLFCHNVFTKDDVEREIGQLISVSDTP